MPRLSLARLCVIAVTACTFAAAAPSSTAQSRLAPTLSITPFDGNHSRCALPNPSESEIREVQAKLYERFGDTGSMRLEGGGFPELIIPTAYHVVTSSTGQGDVPDAGIQAQHDVLNAAYEPWGIQFVMVAMTRTANDDWYGQVDLNAQNTDNPAALDMKTTLGVDPTTTLNVFFTVLANPSTLGYAQFPTNSPEGSPRWSVINRSGTEPGGNQSPYNQGDTATHEVGHALGLFHTFQGGCHADAQCETSGDRVCDTPAEASPYFGSCNTSRDTCPASEGNDPVKNFMDYSDDGCMDEFTEGQAARMNDVLSTFRPQFYANALATGVVVGPSTLEFEETFVGTPLTETLRVLNVTDEDLTVSSVTLPDGFSSDFDGPVVLGNLEGLEIEVTFDAAAAGTFEGDIVVETSYAKEPTYTVAVSASAVLAADINDPEAILTALMPDTQGDESFTIANEGAGDLVWSITGFAAARLIAEGNAMPAAPDAGLPAENLAKGEKATQTGTPVRFGAGGPDAFGYTWIDSDEDGGPTFDFVDISTSGTAIAFSPTSTFPAEDDGVATVALPFSFPFYGDAATEVVVHTNGILALDGFEEGSFANDPIPTSGEPNGFIAVLWDDLDTTPGAVYYEDMGDGRLVVQWEGVSYYQSTVNLTFQAILYANGSVLLQYADLSGGRESDTIGIESQDGTDGLQVAFNTDYAEDDLAVLIAPPAQWITGASPASGLLGPGESVTVTVSLDAADLDPDVYTETLKLRSNDPDEPTKDVSIALAVSAANGPAAPALASPENGATFQPEPGDFTVQVPLAWEASPEAENYDIEIASDEAFANVVDSAQDYAGLNGVTEPLDVGTYFWRVRSNAETIPGPWSAVRSFAIVSGVAGEEQATADETALLGTFPNPLTRSATVRFALAQASDVALVVYDVLGQEVARLTEGAHPAGVHEATFEAAGLAPGLYLVRFAADGVAQTTQVVVAR